MKHDASLTGRGKLAAVISAGVVAGLTVSLGIVPANADKLDDRKDRIEKQIAGTEKDLESVNAMLQKNGEKLRKFQDRLPSAEQADRCRTLRRPNPLRVRKSSSSRGV